MIKGLYAITPDETNTELLLTKVALALQGGVSVLQYRNKSADQALQTQQARAILLLSRQYGVPLIINDSVDICLTIDADGVHIGADDGNLAEIRSKIGKCKLLGASCYNRLDLALAAAKAGVDYVALALVLPLAPSPLRRLPI